MSQASRRVAIVVALAHTVLSASPAWADSVRDREWYLTFLHIPEAQQINQGEGVTVAVVDTGVNPKQPELSGNLLPGYDNMLGIKGWSDDYGHGTAMASLIAAHGIGNGNGALGVAPKAKILPIRVGVTDRDVVYSDLVQGIGWAVDNGAKVINISLGGLETHDERVAIERAIASDVVVVASAGNRPEDSQIQFPAAYPGVVAVAGVDQNGNHADVSVSGSEVLLTAPAVDIVTPLHDELYGTGTGTSPAAAIVSGVAALIRSKYPTMSATEVVHRLTATATDKGPPGRDDEYGYGIVNPVAALTADVPPLPTSPSAGPARTQPTRSHTANTAAPPRNTPTAVIGILIALLLGAGAVGVVIARTRTRR